MKKGDKQNKKYQMSSQIRGRSNHYRVVYDRNHLLGLGSDTETETQNWPKL